MRVDSPIGCLYIIVFESLVYYLVFIKRVTRGLNCLKESLFVRCGGKKGGGGNERVVLCV